MKTLREFRKLNKLSQDNMGVLLKVSRSQVNMAERGLRSLPEQAMERLKKLQQNATGDFRLNIENELAVIQNDQALATAARKFWKERLRENEACLHVSMKKLTGMQKKFSKALVKGRILRQAVEMLTEGDGKPPEIKYVDSLQTEVEDKVLPSAPGAQLDLQLAIDLLLAEAKLLRLYLDPATAPSVADIISRNKNP